MISLNAFIPGPLQKLTCFEGYENLYIKRLDLIRSWATGNKYYKLKNNFADILQNGFKSVVTKGGMFSNHLEATAAACYNFNVTCICLIRSYQEDPSNPTIMRLKEYGAKLIFLPPAEYTHYHHLQAGKDFPGSYFIPEGGANAAGVEGAAQICQECDLEGFRHLIIAGGTLSTAAGMMKVARPEVKITVVPAWKGSSTDAMSSVLEAHNIVPACRWDIWPEFHFGGFGKFNKVLADFMLHFSRQTSIPLDPVYTGKLLFAVTQKINHGAMGKDIKTVVIHTGGLQGMYGAIYRDPQTWKDYLI